MIAYLAKQNRATIAQLRNIMTELVTGVEHGQGLAIFWQLAATEQIDPLLICHLVCVYPQK